LFYPAILAITIRFVIPGRDRSEESSLLRRDPRTIFAFVIIHQLKRP